MRTGIRYTYYFDDVKEDLQAIKKEIWEDFKYEEDFEKDKDDLEELLDIESCLNDDVCFFFFVRPPVLSDEAKDLLEKYYCNDECQLYDLGQRTNFRIYYGCVGFAMAYDDLGLN